MLGYDALLESAAYWDVSSRGRLRISGDDRDPWIQAIAANDIASLAPGAGLYTFFLNAQGRIQSDAHVYRNEDAYWIDCEPEARGTLKDYLERYIIMEDVTIDDLTDSTAAIACEGPSASRVLADVVGADPAAPADNHGGDDGVRWFASTITGQPGGRFQFAAPRISEFMDRLDQAGAMPAPADVAGLLRVENAIPRFGSEFGPANIPHETELFAAFSTHKGCYPGQEIVERVRTQGQVNRLLRPVELETVTVPPPGAEILAGGKVVGTLTSPVLSRRSGRVAGFAMLRRTALDPAIELRCAGALTRIREQPRMVG